jgi:hypothetical protein
LRGSSLCTVTPGPAQFRVVVVISNVGIGVLVVVIIVILATTNFERLGVVKVESLPSSAPIRSGIGVHGMWREMFHGHGAAGVYVRVRPLLVLGLGLILSVVAVMVF